MGIFPKTKQTNLCYLLDQCTLKKFGSLKNTAIGGKSYLDRSLMVSSYITKHVRFWEKEDCMTH